jgi:peptidoglycan/LPS O-acetylase OafA/YrhL
MSATPPRLSNIDVLRGLAAAAVCFFHFSRDHFLGSGATNWVSQKGYLGVDAFFVVSGFVIPLALGNADFRIAQAPRFLAARATRLYPAFFFAATGTILLWFLSALAPGFHGSLPHFTLQQILANATLACGFTGDDWVIPVFWTLAIEAQYYIAIALTHRFVAAPGPTVRIASIAAWCLVPLFCPLGTIVFRYCALFALGIVANAQLKKMLSTPAASLLALGAFAVQWLVAGPASAIVGGCSYLFISYAPVIRFAPLASLGAVSYSLYLIHVPIGGRVINLAFRWQAGFGVRVVEAGGAFAASLIVAALLYRWVEKPSHARSRALWHRRALPVGALGQIHPGPTPS